MSTLFYASITLSDFTDFIPDDEKSVENKAIAKRVRLKKDALPRYWPGFPEYVSKPKPKPRERKFASSAAREERLAIDCPIADSEIESSRDAIGSLKELESKFTDMPDGILRFMNEDHHVYLEISHKEIPSVSYSVKVI